MKKEFVLNLRNINNLRTFVALLNDRVKNTVLAHSMDNIFTVDAKSILGMLSISENDIKVELMGDRTPDMINFNEICKRYEV